MKHFLFNICLRIACLVFLRLFDFLQIVIQAIIVFVILLWTFLRYGRPGLERLLAQEVQRHLSCTPDGNPRQ